MSRQFRTNASLRAEKISRNLIKPFLESRGFGNVRDERKPAGTAQEQLLFATAPGGERVGLSVRLCWRRNRSKLKQKTYSASQLMARLPPGRDWVDAIREKAQRRAHDGATHMLFVQPEGRKIVYAAMMPLSQVAPIWAKQRAESARLIATGALGPKRKKNHAENGRSPTIWLQSDSAPSVAAKLWSSQGVIDLVKQTPSAGPPESSPPVDDTFDDLPVDFSVLGTDSPVRRESQISSVKRDPRVRQAVAQRARGKCERETCGVSRPFVGFLDVHHILGASKSDRVYNCVALCPNCHREAHFANDRDAINKALLMFASSFRVNRAN